MLLSRRTQGKYMDGTWQLISGGLNEDETAWQGALRELREETGLRAREFHRLSTLTQFYRSDNDSLNVAPMFWAIADEGAAVSIGAEHTAFEWGDVEAASARLMWPSDRQALEEVRAVVLGGGIAKEALQVDDATE